MLLKTREICIYISNCNKYNSAICFKKIDKFFWKNPNWKFKHKSSASIYTKFYSSWLLLLNKCFKFQADWFKITFIMWIYTKFRLMLLYRKFRVTRVCFRNEKHCAIRRKMKNGVFNYKAFKLIKAKLRSNVIAYDRIRPLTYFEQLFPNRSFLHRFLIRRVFKPLFIVYNHKIYISVYAGWSMSKDDNRYETKY